MAAFIASICSTLIILAFCQVVVETILPEGGTKRYVMFIAGLVAVLVILTTFTVSGSELMKSFYASIARMEQLSQGEAAPPAASGPSNPYREYIEKLIDTYR